jgi:hypothetical protein
MMTDKPEDVRNRSQVKVDPPIMLFTRDELALKRGLEALYTTDCEIEVARRMADLFPEGNQSATLNDPTLILAAVVYLRITHQVAALCVFADEWPAQELQDLRIFCKSRRIRLYPVDRLQVYALKVFERALIAEEQGLTTKEGYRLADHAKCPHCRGPLIHNFKKEEYGEGYRGLWVCINYYADNGSGLRCNGFICTEENLIQYIEPDVLHFRHQIRREVKKLVETSNTG